MKDDLYYYFTHGVRSKLTLALSSSLSLLICLTVPSIKPEAAKLLLAISALGCSAVAVTSLETSKESDDALDDYSAATGVNRQRRLIRDSFVSAPNAQHPMPNDQHKKLEVFDLHSIGDKRDEFPNVFIVGAPGTGKTSAAEYLGVVLKSGKRYAVHPHAKPSDFVGFDRIFGGGRLIGTPDDQPLTWAELNNEPNPTVAQVFMALKSLMLERYTCYYQGKEDFELIDVYFDELPAIAATLGKKFLADYMPSLIMECRKVKIRLWFLTQSMQVQSLGLEGISDLREGATVIRLGKLALKEAGTLYRKKELSQAEFDYISSSDRPVLVDDTIAKLPGWVEMQAAIKAFTIPLIPTSAPAKMNRQRTRKPHE